MESLPLQVIDSIRYFSIRELMFKNSSLSKEHINNILFALNNAPSVKSEFVVFLKTKKQQDIFDKFFIVDKSEPSWSDGKSYIYKIFVSPGDFGTIQLDDDKIY